MSKPRRRHVLLWGALASSVAAAFWVRGEDVDRTAAVALPARAPARPAETAAPQAPALALDRLGRRAPADTDADPFRAKIWYVPQAAPAPMPPEPPPMPTAPPLPFQYVGKFEEAVGGKPVIYLTKGNESFYVSPGDTFDKVYRFEAIERSQMVIVYLPLSVKQRLPIGVQE